MAYENANVECKMILKRLKIRSAPMDEWILHKMNVETVDYDTEAREGKAISNDKRRHQNVLIVVEWDI